MKKLQRVSSLLSSGAIAALIPLSAFAAPPAETPELIAKGKAAYTVSCALCHGDKLDGNGVAGQYLNPKPRNLVADKYKAGDTKDKIFETVSKGLTGTTMTAYGHLPEADRWALVYYIHSLRKK